ncbi:amidohydrolase, partial [Pseudoalteromonas sp. S979]
ACYRSAWADAQEYMRAWVKYDAHYEAGLNPVAPGRDIMHDPLRAVIEGEVFIHNHCYKAEEMAMMIDLSKVFGYHAGT